ncbi:hypothetical protein NDU88_008549 [Pleurodeles waltl]|uniref:Uncharacterized protein n=1 Tax=Pleurodeles waltl TaxID=8319 RepID=A0AAV7NA31_PLEWA|nr:hypothetical protein NDU88_008549 [Pleurodeles waltl]
MLKDQWLTGWKGTRSSDNWGWRRPLAQGPATNRRLGDVSTLVQRHEVVAPSLITMTDRSAEVKAPVRQTIAA